MVECLRGKFLYCEKRARDFIFDAVEEIIKRARGRRLRLHRLRRFSTDLARKNALARGYGFLNWEIGTKTTLHAMLRAGALQTHPNHSVSPHFRVETLEITGLLPDFRDRTESFLLGFIIQELGDVTTRDHTALAHALFRQFDPSVSREDMEDRVTFLLARLAGTVASTLARSIRPSEIYDPGLIRKVRPASTQ
jgi:hypothetical protein